LQSSTMPTIQPSRSSPKRRVRGATTLEVITAASITTIVLFSSIMVLIAGVGSWARGVGKINAENRCRQLVRSVANEVRSAMSVTVDGDGLGLSYRMPKLDSNGDVIAPVEWDGVERRIELVEDRLVQTIGDTTRVLAEDVSLTDPEAPDGSPDIRIFTPGSGSITRQLTIHIVTQSYGKGQEIETARARETVYLRNIPELTR